MKKFFLLISVGFLLSLILFTGCDSVPPVSKYKLDGIYFDPQDVRIFEGSQSGSVNLCFDIKNNAEITLLPKIEITYDELGKKCLDKIYEKDIKEIVPGMEKHLCYSVSTKYDLRRNEKLREDCENTKVEVYISLQDISGTELDRGSAILGII